MTKKINYKIVIAGIAALTAIEITALLKGINGQLFSLIAGLIGLAIGVGIKSPIK